MTDKCKSCDFFFEFSDKQGGMKGICDNHESGKSFLKDIDFDNCSRHNKNTNPLIWYNMEDSEYQPSQGRHNLLMGV